MTCQHNTRPESDNKMMPAVQANNIAIEPIPNPFVGNWDIEQGSQYEVKIGGQSHFYFLFRDRLTGCAILGVGRDAQTQFYVMDRLVSMRDLFVQLHGDGQWRVEGGPQNLLTLSIAHMFRDGLHGSVDVAP